MPVIQQVVLADRTTPTAVSHTFKPVGEKDGVVVLKTSSTEGVLLDQKKLSVSCRTANGRIKAKQVLALPVVVTETVNGISRAKVERTAYVTMTFDFAESSTEAERNNAEGMAQSALAAAVTMIHGAVVKGEGYFGG